MNEVKDLFKAIGREDIDPKQGMLLSRGEIDSLDIMGLVSAIEKKYNKVLDSKYIDADNFESFEAIKKMLDQYLGR